jgi:uncharacterized membrane protein
MIVELICACIAAAVLTFLYYIDSNLVEEDNDLNKYLKYFGVNFAVIFVTIYIYSLKGGSGIDSYTVNVGLPKF